MTVRLECRLCGSGFERPAMPDGLCRYCAKLRILTKRQREVLLAYARPGTDGVPSSIRQYLDSSVEAKLLGRARAEQHAGCRLAGLVRVLNVLVREELLDQGDEKKSPVCAVRITSFGRKVAHRLEQAEIFRVSNPGEWEDAVLTGVYAEGWYHWDETHTGVYGPFRTRYEAVKSFRRFRDGMDR